MKVFTETCWKCGLPFGDGEYVNWVKLDDGSIRIVHGGSCSDVPVGKHRLPMKNGDWWIKRVGTVHVVPVSFLVEGVSA